MLEKESIIKINQKEKNGNSGINKEEIAGYFSRNAFLDRKNIDAIKQLLPREAFALLVSARPKFIHSAIHVMGEFPEPETVRLLLELRRDPEYIKEIETIDFLIFKFAHNQKSSREAIDALRKLGDPRAILEIDSGKIELATELVLAEVVSGVPVLDKQKDWLLKCFREGAVFTLRTKDDKLASVAIAHQLPDYSLYIDYIYTIDSYRKHGYAVNLLAYLLDNHAVLRCDLLRGNMLSEKALKQLGFKRDGMGERWTY